MFGQPIYLFLNADTLLIVGYCLLGFASVAPLGLLGWKLASYFTGD